MKNYILLVFLLLLAGCGGCGFSERCYSNRERERILSLSDKERSIEIKNCITQKQRAIDNTSNEREYCTFWQCHLGKEDFRKMQKTCPAYYDPASWKK